MRVLIVGGGGREHALAWKISQSPLLKELYCAPGNAGIASVAECLQINSGDIDTLKNWSLENKIDLVVVGPEGPLTAGIADRMRGSGIAVFGPGAAGARLESSKSWAKEKMVRCGIPTADFAVFHCYEKAAAHLEHLKEGPVVIKADGLAAGKGVTVASSRKEALESLKAIMVEGVFGKAGSSVVIEEYLTGEEVSVLAITDGNDFLLLPSAQDHKAIGEGDQGANTGGMGAYSPAPLLTDALTEKVKEQVFKPLLAGFAREGIGYRGVIYAGLMVSGENFKVLEFNARFGDPEAQAILPRLDSDLLPVLMAAAGGDITGIKMSWSKDAAVCVVMASGGYPEAYETGFIINGLDKVKALEGKGLTVFHAGTKYRQGNIVTSGGRVLGVTAWDKELPSALEKVYGAVSIINFNGAYYRRDIAHRAR